MYNHHFYVFAYILCVRVLIQFLPFMKWFWSLLMVMQVIYWSMPPSTEIMS